MSMDRIVIKGGKRLEGEVTISGAKNSALPILASGLLSKGESHISNVPELNSKSWKRSPSGPPSSANGGS